MTTEARILVEWEWGRRKSCERRISKLEYAMKNSLKLIRELEDEI